MGFANAGFKVLFANEIDKYACETYRLNFSGCNLIEGDICALDAGILPRVDVLCAGFPCQPFSVCGKQLGFGDKRGNLFFEIMRIADCLQPQLIFLENVANLTEHAGGKTFNAIHNELASRDYTIRYIIADACDYGVPQHRTRTYILAFRNLFKAASYRFPEKTALIRRITDVIDTRRKAAEDLYLSESDRDYIKLNRFISDKNQLYRFSDYGIQASRDGISFTLKANMGTWYKRVPYIKDDFGIRKITPEECLALQGFPSGFRFSQSTPQNEKYKQCGNTVVVSLVQALAKNAFEIM